MSAPHQPATHRTHLTLHPKTRLIDLLEQAHADTTRARAERDYWRRRALHADPTINPDDELTADLHATGEARN